MPATGPQKPARKCPICGKPSAGEFSPFCSARCQDVDLNRWLSNRYVIPSDEPAAAEDGNGPPPDDAGDDAG
ncbi:MAG TPA: DNA gyrase inhibitor YacG [Devosia sp.]|nr:DNA gyrase inhibitor YacG [Devosia sp.]